MFVTVRLCYEDGGRPIPRHREAMPLPEIPGWLILREQIDNTVRRTTRIAQLHNDRTNGRDVLQPLHDAVVLWVLDGFMCVTGLEEDALTRKRTAQSWHIRLPIGQL